MGSAPAILPTWASAWDGSSAGIIPALEPAHALAKVMQLAPKLPREHLMVMNLCGRGDKDIFAVAEKLGFDI